MIWKDITEGWEGGLHITLNLSNSGPSKGAKPQTHLNPPGKKKKASTRSKFSSTGLYGPPPPKKNTKRNAKEKKRL